MKNTNRKIIMKNPKETNHFMLSQSVIKDKKVKIVFQTMGSSLHTAIANTSLDEEEADLLTCLDNQINGIASITT